MITVADIPGPLPAPTRPTIVYTTSSVAGLASLRAGLNPQNR